MKLLRSTARRRERLIAKVALISAMVGGTTSIQAQSPIDVWDSTDPGNYVLVGTIQTIYGPQTGKQHYDFYSASGHPNCVDLGPLNANIWMHENTLDQDLTFGFIFGIDNVNVGLNYPNLKFRIVDSSTDPYVAQSDDGSEAIENPPGSNAFEGSYKYKNNTDGIAVSGVGGTNWTIIMDSIDFGNIEAWSAAGGGFSDGTQGCIGHLNDIPLILGHEYRLTPAGNSPSGAPVNPLANADAGEDYAVNEEELVTLDGHLSSSDLTLAYSWVWLSGPTVVLDSPTSIYPTFTAPVVEAGGATITFGLTVTDANGADSDTVDITVVNVNHTPVADAGEDLSIAEGSPVAIDGSNSFDIDNDPITYSWAQTDGPEMLLTGESTPNLSFTAPYFEASGAPGIVATLVFELTVDDHYPTDAPAAGYDFSNVVDRVTVEITNVNNDPIADAGSDQTLNENSAVTLDGANSSDPDSDALTYAWVQDSGSAVVLTGDATATPSFTAPFVNSGGGSLVFELTVNDGYGGTDTSTVTVNVQNANDPPLASAAQPSVECLWPPNHKLVSVGIIGVSDPEDNATITIDSVTQDEVANGLGDGDTAVDAIINADGTVFLRAERSGKGNGRVYHIHFTASDYEGSASGVVSVCVPHSKKKAAVDGGELFNSTN